MAVTAKQVFDTALALMDEVQETGTIGVESPLEYQTKALSILNTLQFELLPPSQTPVLLTSLSQNLSVSDRTARLILPYGLAAHLMVIESSTSSSASYFNDRYEELKRKVTASPKPITDAYNSLNGMV